MYLRTLGGHLHLSASRRASVKFAVEIRWRQKQSYFVLSNLSTAIVNFYEDRYTERRRTFHAT